MRVALLVDRVLQRLIFASPEAYSVTSERDRPRPGRCRDEPNRTPKTGGPALGEHRFFDVRFVGLEPCAFGAKSGIETTTDACQL